MPIKVSDANFSNIIEIWGHGPNTIEVHTGDGRQVKITAAHNIRSGATPNYYAHYEEIQEIKIDKKTLKVWVAADYPWQVGETVEGCLRGALVWVDRDPQNT
ncbi:hypothetical protein BHU72_11950 [Desulfuribacillus stibiiarsenatis]|uniref:Uncharacterized protein n=1 Tax=Desulfuribacillus stibiiarsenatis TaxID=1390249 RepID=A0A1E5L7V4_9FIRM|nr:hypothetical protein [Desulfuribacillus stibiiarsenatis]OEH86242.1 hypothetical protein BHU72_11950 [Desulfuribacillus stibiiarsenatis]